MKSSDADKLDRHAEAQNDSVQVLKLCNEDPELAPLKSRPDFTKLVKLEYRWMHNSGTSSPGGGPRWSDLSLSILETKLDAIAAAILLI